MILYGISHTKQKITTSDAAGSDGFGKSVSVSGSNIIACSPDDDDNGLSSGSVYVIARGTSTWAEVAKLVCRGFDNDRISEKLGVEYNTVRAHLGNIFRKAGVKGKAELILAFVEVLRKVRI